MCYRFLKQTGPDYVGHLGCPSVSVIVWGIGSTSLPRASTTYMRGTCHVPYDR